MGSQTQVSPASHSGSRRVLISEKTVTGHRLYYVRLLADALIARGDYVHIATSVGALGSAEAALHLSELAPEIELTEHRDLSLHGLELLSRQFNSDVTVVPDGDWLLPMLLRRVGWRGAGKLNFLVMRENSQSGKWIKRAFGTAGKRGIARLVGRMTNVNPIFLKSAVWKGKQKNIARDPVTQLAGPADVSNVRLDLGLAKDKYWFAVVGSITSRKNLPLVARALSNFGSERTGFLIAGVCPPEELELARKHLDRLRSQSAQVVIVNRLLGDVEMDALVLASDCLVLAHSNEGPSGLLGKAANSGTRVVAAGAQSLRADTSFVPSLATWVTLDETALTRALQQAQEEPAPDRIRGLNAADFAVSLA